MFNVGLSGAGPEQMDIGDMANRLKQVLYASVNRLARFLTQTRAGRILVFVSLPLAIIWLAMWKPSHEPPIFDAQVHYNEESWRRVSVRAILNTAEEINVPWLLVGSTPNEGTWRLQRADATRVIPMFVPYQRREDRDNWFEQADTLAFMQAAIRQGSYRGIGEFRLFDGQVDNPVVRGMVKLAAENHLILHARSDPYAIRQLFALEPGLRILWAHAGMFTQPQTISDLLDEYPNLWVEISHRGDVAPNGRLAADWRKLMLRHYDRFLLGSGTYNSSYWYQFRYAMSRYRAWLQELPPEIAERIAFRNGLELFGIPLQAVSSRQG